MNEIYPQAATFPLMITQEGAEPLQVNNTVELSRFIFTKGVEALKGGAEVRFLKPNGELFGHIKDGSILWLNGASKPELDRLTRDIQAGLPQVVYLISYPLPDDNPACKCAGNPSQQIFCRFGHMTECHAPSLCLDARCGHLLKYDCLNPDVRTELISSDQFATGILKWFKESGVPLGADCICSLCGLPVMPDADAEASGLPEVLRFYSMDGLEVRFHPVCAGQSIAALLTMTGTPQAEEDAPPVS